MNYDLEIHLKKVVSQGVNKDVMEHLVKFYRDIALGYKLLAYDGHKKPLCCWAFAIPIQGVPNKPSWGR